jgi:hypothetical protein
MKKQTAVEWLFAEYINPKNQTSMASLFLEALLVEKKQIEDAYLEGDKMEGRASLDDAGNYYNETYGDK